MHYKNLKIAKKYAKALFEDAKSSSSLDKVQKDLDKLLAAIDDNQELSELFSNPIIPKAVKQECLSEITKRAKFNKATINFLSLLATNNKLLAITDISECYKNNILEHNNELVVDVLTSNKVNKKQQTQLIDKLSKSTGKNIILNLKKEPNIIGGLVIKIGSHMIDNSLKTKLKNIELEMKGEK